MFKKNKFNISYKKSGNIFNQHSYWTKQPVEAIEKFIKKHTNEGDIVLDPFCGSGMTGLAANFLKRKSVLLDNSPASIHISSGFLMPQNFKDEELNFFLSNINKELYELDFVQVGNSKIRKKYLFDVIGENYEFKEKKYSISEELFKSVKNGKTCKSKIDKKYSFHDFKPIYRVVKNNVTKKKEYYKITDSIIKNEKLTMNRISKSISILPPETKFFGKEPQRNFKKNIFKVSDLYSRRNLICLLLIKQRIDELKNSDLKKFLNFVFSSILFNTSLMSRYRKYENTSIRMGTYYIPPLIKDNNVIESFNKKAKLILKHKQDIFKKYKYKNFSKIFLEDASKLNRIKTNSIDFIYTDPPYGDVINYSELNIVYESWLGIHKKYKNEMIINSASGKDENYYFNLFRKFLFQASRVLKKNKSMVIVFHHPELDLWRKLQECLIESKFFIKTSKFPIRIISNNKTASQRQTNKNTQSFLALELVNLKKSNSSNLKKISSTEIAKIINQGKSKGYETKSERYDFFINHVFTKYKIPEDKNFKKTLEKYLLI